MMMTRFAHEERGALLDLSDAFTTLHRDAVVTLAARYRLPAVYPYRLFAVVGGLMSYDRIFKGAKPGDLPVQNPTKFELVINLKTAKALGITVATPLVAAADEVIE
jgi:putative ABC transport system substrate-binding protein